MTVRRPRYLRKPARSNVGIISPQFIIHTALSHLPSVFGNGTYGKDSMEEAIFANLSHTQVEACLHALQKRPPSVSLRFPFERSQLPMITVMREGLRVVESLLGEFAGEVDEDITPVQDEMILTPSSHAVGGETIFYLPTAGTLISSSIELVIRRGSEDIELDQNAGDFFVDSAQKKITLTSPLLAGDIFVVTRHAYYGLPGGEMSGMVFQYSGVVFVETENPILTTFLEGIIWREFMLQHETMISSGFADIEVGFRDISQWDQIQPAIGYRSEITTSGLVSWTAYQRYVMPHIGNVELSQDYTGVEGNEVILQLSFDLVSWDADSNDCER